MVASCCASGAVAGAAFLPRHQFGTKPCGVTVKFVKRLHMGGVGWGKGDKPQQTAAD